MKILVVLPQKTRWMAELERSLRLVADIQFITLEAWTYGPNRDSSDGVKKLSDDLKALSRSFDYVIFNFEFFEELLEKFWIPIIQDIASTAGVIFWFFDSYRCRDLYLSVIKATAPACCFFACYLDKMWFSSFYVNSFYVPLEGSYECYNSKSTTRGSGTGFIGSQDKMDRSSYFLAQAVCQRIQVPACELTYTALADFIKSKELIVNFSQVEEDYLGRVSRVLKGRVLETGLCGRLIVSDYCSELEELFHGLIPYFSNVDTLCDLLDNLLSDESELRNRTLEFGKICESHRPSIAMVNALVKL